MFHIKIKNFPKWHFRYRITAKLIPNTMKKTRNQYSFKRKLYGVLTVLFLSSTILLFLISQFVRDGAFGVEDNSVTFGLISYICLTLTAIFLRLEINFSDKEKCQNK